MFGNIINNLTNINLFLVTIVFTFSLIILLTKYIKYSRVIKELDIFEEVSDKIKNDKNLLIFVIDTYKCTSCIKIFPEIKKTMMEYKVNFIAIDSRSKQNFVTHSQVPAILINEKGKIIKKFFPYPDRPKNELTQYQNFIKEAAIEWRKH